MLSAGLFVTLYDIETLWLYLSRGVYGFLMPPVEGEINPRSRHYAALGDYGCIRRRAHVFFFLKRQIVYGGQIVEGERSGGFYLNGPLSPLGRKAGAPLCWDESTRQRYQGTGSHGVFTVPEVGTRCQPYLIRYEDRLKLKGLAIPSDELYFELGGYPYPLPSNVIQGMSFCTMTPGETSILLRLIKEKGRLVKRPDTLDPTELTGPPRLYRPDLSIKRLSEAVNEAHLEAEILANPLLLPERLRPNRSVICRQVPISPFKPGGMDRADICYYSEPLLREGTIPNVIIELKYCQAGKNEVAQLERYTRWLWKVVPDLVHQIKFYLLAPAFKSSAISSVPKDLKEDVELITFNETLSLSSG